MRKHKAGRSVLSLPSQYNWVIAGFAGILIGYLFAKHRAKGKMMAMRQRRPLQPGQPSPTLQQPGAAPVAQTPPGARDSMGFADLGDMSCGNQPCGPGDYGCNQPAVAQADIPQEEFEFMS